MKSNMHDITLSTMFIGKTFDEIDGYGKENKLTIVYADWHLTPEYRVFKTGTLLSRNEDYPSGLILVDNTGKPRPYRYPTIPELIEEAMYEESEEKCEGCNENAYDGYICHACGLKNI